MNFNIDVEIQELRKLTEDVRKDERQRILDKFDKLKFKVLLHCPSGIDTTEVEELLFDFEQEILNPS